jgi:para-aminobenzoate synthetase/4-amino-4-deoxychorismate lyase
LRASELGETDAVVRDDEAAIWRWYRGDAVPWEVTAETAAEVPEVLRQVEQGARDGAAWVGYLAYGAGQDPSFPSAPGAFPAAWFRAYPRPPERVARLIPCPVPRARWNSEWSDEAYADAVERIRRRIGAGDTYQVNLTFRLRAEVEDLRKLWFALAAFDPPLYALYVESPAGKVASLSPERFVFRRGRRLITEPMKGTRRRDVPGAKTELARSPKDRAENLMIVDMLRNDLGRIAQPGSIQVTELFSVRPHRTVWQMTSRIEAESDVDLAEVVAALHPCASVTGAPKTMAMRIIAAHEPSARDLYCGALGAVHPGGDYDLAVAIRTLTQAPGQPAEYGVGSGIIWDSQPDLEAAECAAKAQALEPPEPPCALETLRWDPVQGWFLFEEHLHRLRSTCQALGFRFDEPAIRGALEAQANGEFARRVRLTVDADGMARATGSPLRAPEPLTAVILANAVRSDDLWIRHKTTYREVYERAAARKGAEDEAILVNEHGNVTECLIGNLAVLIDGRWYTPPVEDGLLPGLFRAKLLAEGVLAERSLTVREVSTARALARINSVSAWVPLSLVQSTGSPST